MTTTSTRRDVTELYQPRENNFPRRNLRGVSGFMKIPATRFHRVRPRPPPRDGDHFPNFSDKLDSMLKYTFEKRKHTTGFRSEPRYGIFTSWPINSYVRNEMRVSIRPLIRHLYVYGNLSSCSLKSTLFSYGISSVPKIKRRGRKKLFPP